MNHGLLCDLLDVPEVPGVGRAVEVVAGPLSPAVERQLERTHEVLAGQHRVLLVPHDRLAEVEPRTFQRAGVVAQVGVPAPDVEAAAGDQHARRVTEPGVEHLVERLVGHEVVGQRPVLGAELLVRRLGLLGVTCQVQLLMVATGALCLAFCLGERRVARCDRVVATRLHLHVVRRVHGDELDHLAVQQPVDVLGLGRVAAQ